MNSINKERFVKVVFWTSTVLLALGVSYETGIIPVKEPLDYLLQNIVPNLGSNFNLEDLLSKVARFNI